LCRVNERIDEMNTPILGYDERLPLYQRLREEMLAKIAAGEWMPGAPIPTEAELTRLYGVAIGTVRKAVDTLVNEGLLLRSQGRGTFVRRPNFDASLARFFRQVDASGGREIPGSRILARTVEEPADTVSAALRLQDGEKVIHLERLRIIEGRTLFTRTSGCLPPALLRCWKSTSRGLANCCIRSTKPSAASVSPRRRRR